MRIYVQEQQVYPPGFWGAFNGLQPLLNPWPSNNCDYLGRTFTDYQGPRQSVWVCPGYNRIQGLIYYDRYGYDAVSYGYNFGGQIVNLGVIDDGNATRGLAGISAFTSSQGVGENLVLNPSDMIAFGDAAMEDNTDFPVPFVAGDPKLDWGIFVPPVNTYMALGAPPSTGVQQSWDKRHGARWNIGFCDGHVEQLRRQDVFNVTRPEQMKRWNRDNIGYPPGG